MGAESSTLLDHSTKKTGKAVADPGFPRGANLKVRCTNLLLGKIFAKSCMKMIEFGLRGRAYLALSLDPPLQGIRIPASTNWSH